MSLSEKIPELLREFDAALHENIVPFWLAHGRDEEYGGFHGALDRRGRVADPQAPKSLVQTARFLWSFSALYRLEKKAEYRAVADEAFFFLERHFRDGECGGWRYQTARDGAPKISDKHLYHHAYLLYGLAEYARAFGDEKAAGRARECVELFETKGRDDENGGYIESFTRDWKEKPQNPEFGRSGRYKTMNMHFHLMEAYTNQLAASGDERVRRRLSELIDLILERIIDPETGRSVAFFTYDWKPLPSPPAFGHDIELSWLLHDAAEAAGRGSEKKILGAVIRLADAVLEEGFDRERGGVRPPEGDAKIWWEQSEALVGFLNAWKLTGEEKYAGAFLKTWDWIKNYQEDRDYGEWRGAVSPDGIKDDTKGGVWKTPYHTVRACLEILERLEK